MICRNTCYFFFGNTNNINFKSNSKNEGDFKKTKTIGKIASSCFSVFQVCLGSRVPTNKVTGNVNHIK